VIKGWGEGNRKSIATSLSLEKKEVERTKKLAKEPTPIVQDSQQLMAQAQGEKILGGLLGSIYGSWTL